MHSEHIVTAYDVELRSLRDAIVALGRMACQQLDQALQALRLRDQGLAQQIIEQDRELDAKEREIEAQAIRLLALRQPVAVDLRVVVTALKVATNLERIGDFAANIAKRTFSIIPGHLDGPLQQLLNLRQTVSDMVQDVITAYKREDYETALAVRERDSQVDALYTSLFRELLTYMMESPREISPSIHLLFTAKNIERIGDHATNVAEQVCFLLRGELPALDRHKEDYSSFTVVPPPEAGKLKDDSGSA